MSKHDKNQANNEQEDEVASEPVTGNQKTEPSDQSTGPNGQNLTTDELEKKCEELEHKYKRALADYQNLEKRVKEDKQQWIQTANKELILRLLPVLDTLYLANQHLNDEGLNLSIKKFLGILSQEGLSEFLTKGMKFDPELMEAVGTADGEEGRIIEQVRAGYKLNDTVIRPAQVIVGERKSNVSNSTPPESQD